MLEVIINYNLVVNKNCELITNEYLNSNYNFYRINKQIGEIKIFKTISY